jgi:sugar phosphate permease
MKSDKIIFFFLGWAGMAFYFTRRWIYRPLIPSLMKKFGVSKTTLGVVGSSSLWDI